MQSIKQNSNQVISYLNIKSFSVFSWNLLQHLQFHSEFKYKQEPGSSQGPLARHLSKTAL